MARAQGRSRSPRESSSRPRQLATAEQTVRVMTFNMRLETCQDSDREGQNCSWTARRDLFLQVILRELPDLLGIQEAMPGQIEDLKKALGSAGFACFSQARDGLESEGMFIAIRPPWRATRTGAFWLAVDTPDVPGSKAFGARLPRIALWASLEMEGSAQKLLFLNTHLDHPTTEVAEGIRTRSAEQISDFIKKDWHGWPAVITLDANEEPGAPAHRKFIEGGLVDSWAECHPELALDRPTTFHLFQGRKFAVPSSWAEGCWPGSLGPGGRKTCHIDWILHTPSLKATFCEIDRTEIDGQPPPSDHFAVISTLRFA